MSKKPFALMLSMSAVLLLVLWAGSGSGVESQERHEVTVRLVLVDVLARDREGRFVPGLAKEDFLVFEDGKEVPVQSLEVVRLNVRPAASEATPQAGTAPTRPRESHFIVLFDSINTIQRMLEREKPKIVERLMDLVKRGQSVMVYELHENEGLKLIQPFTRDEALIVRAVEAASGSIWVEHEADALAVPSIVQPQSETMSFEGVTHKFEFFSREQFQFQTRIRFEKTINGLLAVLNGIKDLPGRKSILLVSGGIPTISFVRHFSGQGGPLTDNIAVQSQVEASNINDPFKVLGKSGYRSGGEIFEDLVRFANSFNISFYALDPDNYLRYVMGDIAYDNFPRKGYSVGQLRSIGVRQPDEVEEIKRAELAALKALAVDTAGQAFLGGDKFEDFQESVDRSLSEYYVLSFSPRNRQPDGKYHKIEVKAKPPGLDLRFRRGYMDYTAAQEEALLLASASYNPGLFKDILFESNAVPLRQSDGRYLLWFHTAIPTRTLLAEAVEEEAPLKLKFQISLNSTGAHRELLSEVAIPLSLPYAFVQTLKSAGVFGFNCCSQELELKPGAYEAVIALSNPFLGLVGTAVRTVEIPGLKGADAPAILNEVFGTLIEHDETGFVPFTVAREDGALLLSHHRFHPMAVPRLTAGREAVVFVQLSAPDNKNAFTPRFSLQAGDAPEQAVAGELVEKEYNKRAKAWNLVYRLDLKSFGRGSYAFKIIFASDTAGRLAERTLAVHVF